MAYLSKRTGEEVDALLDKVEKGDFDIEVDTFLSETSNNAIANGIVTKEFRKKVDKIEGKGLSTNDFTNADKALVDTIPNLVTNEQLEESLVGIDGTLRAKADTNGYYPNMSVGMADNLVGRGEAQEAMFSLRPSGGKSINDGTARITSIKGNSVVYNQLIKNRINALSSGVSHTIVDCVDNWGGVSTSATTGLAFQFQAHVYYLDSVIIANPNGLDITFAGEGTGKTGIFSAKGSESGIFWYIPKGASLDGVIVTIVLRDLTKMFGAGNEPTTVEEFYARKPIGIDEYANKEGVILDNRVSEIKSISNNAYDPTLGYARVIGGKTYNFDGTFGEVQFSATIDGAREAIEVADGGQYTMPNDGYVWLSGSDICVCLAHSYEKPYSEHEVDIVNMAMVQEVFPEGMRSAGTACDEIRYNKTTKKWEKLTRIAVVDLGSLTWTTDAVGDKIGFVCRKAVVTPPKSIYTKPNMLCAPFETTTQAGNNQYANDNVIFSNTSGWLFVAAWEYNGDATAFKTAMDGVMLYYELAEPTVEPIEGSENWNLDYRAWDFGTEEAIASMPSAPFRANIVYEFNAVDDIRWAYAEIKKLQARVTQLESAQASENPITE